MAATFFTSTAILISLGSFSAAFRPGVFDEISHALNLFGTRNETLFFLLFTFGSIWQARNEFDGPAKFN